MTLERDKRTWDALAAADPLWSVSTVPAFLGGENVAEFFATGSADVTAMFDFLAHAGVEPARGRALDFGCGVGRLSAALAEHFAEVVGVDISAEMVRLARGFNERDNLRFQVNGHADLTAFEDESFDLVLSLAVLQHVSDPAAIRSYIREFARVARPGGVIVFQLPANTTARTALPRVVTRVLPVALAKRFRRLRPYLMSVTPLREAEVTELLRTAGAELVAVVSDNRLGTTQIDSLAYCARLPGAHV
jgi:2-polyprenyl-3-methyl-5-hydroxy-6-metoxy-1,4-benzoquinol methylase